MTRAKNYPDVPNTPILTKFSSHVLACCIANKMDHSTFPALCHQYGQKFIYGSAMDLGLGGCDDKPMFWAYLSDLFDHKNKAQLSPIM